MKSSASKYHHTNTCRYKYSGKELDRTCGLNLYDFSARRQDAALGQFTTVDPLAEEFYSISPYAYCAGNPIMLIDPTGKETKYSLDPHEKENKLIIHAAMKNPKNQDIHLYAHGDSHTIKLYIKGKDIFLNSAKELKTFIESTFIHGKDIEEREITVVLHSCDTGVGKNSIAQQLSAENPNLIVVAPNGKIRVSSTGEERVIGKIPHWNVFNKGEIINNVPADERPHGKYAKDWLRAVEDLLQINHN